MTKSFAFEVKVKIGLESTYLDSWGAKIGFNVPLTDRVKS